MKIGVVCSSRILIQGLIGWLMHSSEHKLVWATGLDFPKQKVDVVVAINPELREFQQRLKEFYKQNPQVVCLLLLQSPISRKEALSWCKVGVRQVCLWRLSRDEFFVALEQLSFAKEQFREGCIIDSPAVLPFGRKEMQLMALIAWGITLKEAALRLRRSEKTLNAQRYNVYQKLDIHQAADLTLYAQRVELIDIFNPPSLTRATSAALGAD
jgi:DNA-binding NarL/FixJ family response regulator